MESSSGSEDFSDTIFWFLHENSDFSGSSSEWVDDDEIEDSVDSDHVEKTAFWHDQEQLLRATLCRTTPTETRVGHAIEEAVMETAPPCRCQISATEGACKSCSRKEMSDHLCRAGFDCYIRNSKWNKSSNIPSGKHTYLEVVEGKKRVIVELYFKADFEMARGGDHYDHLVSLLPEVFVGKPERLRNVVKILCEAAKRCTKENNMHVPPWRKLKYVQSKWLWSTSSVPETGESLVSGFSGGRSSRKPGASLLTLALLESFPRCKVVAVV